MNSPNAQKWQSAKIKNASVFGAHNLVWMYVRTYMCMWAVECIVCFVFPTLIVDSYDLFGFIFTILGLVFLWRVFFLLHFWEFSVNIKKVDTYFAFALCIHFRFGLVKICKQNLINHIQFHIQYDQKMFNELFCAFINVTHNLYDNDGTIN